MGDVPRSELFDDVYFSAHDGPGETAHVFFDGNNLPERWQGRDRFTVAETGFGTGLNFLLCRDLFDRTAPEGAFLDFISVEKFPLSAAQIRGGLAPWAGRLEPYLSEMLKQYPILVPGFHRMVFGNRAALTLIFGDANEALGEVEGGVDAWFLDGFTPSKNPDMWTDEVFTQMARLCNKDATFATFTAAGFVKRGLRAAGFTVEKRRGFGPKRDMLAGVYAGEGAAPISRAADKNIAIHGAGLAGCAAAFVLQKYGFKPVLYDPDGIASGASGNDVGLINPRFTAFRSAESDFYTAGFAQTLRSFSGMKHVAYNPCGALHLITDDDKEKRFTRTAQNWGWNDAHMRIVDAAQASEISGVAVRHAALYLPDAPQISPRALCEKYAQGVPFVKDAAQLPHGAVIYAQGAGLPEMFPDLPIHTVRGQISYVKASTQSAGLRVNLCYGGYFAAPVDGIHALGSTFQKWLTGTDLRDEDNADNLAKLAANVPSLGALEITGARAALRTASRDRFPVIGPVGADAYISGAHGSHGILSTLLGAHILADYLRGGPFSVGKSTLNALHPQRFSKTKV